MSKNSDLAIIVPIRNTPVHLIDSCLKSVFDAMKYSRKYDVEVIAIDDCSEIEHYYKYTSYIKNAYPTVIIQRSETWVGIGGARNMGANLSDSEYLLFIDSDDILKKTAIVTLMEYSFPKRVVFANHIRIGNDYKGVYSKVIFLEIIRRCCDIVDCPFLYTNFIGMPAVIPKNLFTQIGGYPKRVYSGEHVDLWGKLYFGSDMEEIVHIDDVLYEYHPRKNGNRFGDLKHHVLGKCEQFKILAKSLGLNVVEYICCISKYNPPSLYIPIFKNDGPRIPPWAEINNDSWKVKKEFINLHYKRQATSYNSGHMTTLRSAQIAFGNFIYPQNVK